MKILLLTRNHPVETWDVTQKLINTFGMNGYVDFISPQCVATIVNNTKGIPYTSCIYPALHQVEEQKEELASKTTHFVMIGSVDKKSLKWYDVVIGLKNDDILDYTIFNEEYNPYHYKFTNLKDADVIFDNIDELIIFLKRIMELKVK